MRTLLVIEKTSAFGYLIHKHVHALREAGHDLTVCFLTGPVSEENIRAAHPVPVRFLQLPTKAVRGSRLSGAMQLLRLIREIDPDVVISEQYSSVVCSTFALIMHRKKFKNVAILHGPTPGKASIRRIFYATFGRLIDNYVLVSRTQMERFLGHNPSIRPAKARVISNIIDSQSMQPQLLTKQKARAELDIDQNRYTFGFVGRFNVKKGVYELISAFERVAKDHPQCSLVLVGYGPEEQAMRDIIEASPAGSQIIMVGKVPEAWRYMRAFDVFVFPSWAESFGMVLVEAMQAEVPVMACDDGVMPGVLGDAALSIVPVNNEEALFHALKEATDIGEEKRNHVVAKGMERVSTVFSYARMLEDFRKLTKDIQS